MYMSTWAVAEMQMQEVCTSAQPLGNNITLGGGSVVCLLWVYVPGLPVSRVVLSKLLGLLELLLLSQWVSGLAWHESRQPTPIGC